MNSRQIIGRKWLLSLFLCLFIMRALTTSIQSPGNKISRQFPDLTEDDVLNLLPTDTLINSTKLNETKNSTHQVETSESAQNAITTMLPTTFSNNTTLTAEASTISSTIQTNVQLQNSSAAKLHPYTSTTAQPSNSSSTTETSARKKTSSSDVTTEKLDNSVNTTDSNNLGWSSIFTKKFWQDQIYAQNYVLAILLPIAAGVSLALVVVCACCLLNKICTRRRHNKIDKVRENYYGRSSHIDSNWMLLAPNSSDEEI